MAFLSAQDEQALRQHLAAIDRPVILLLFTQTIGGSESGQIAKQILDEVARLNDKITIEERNFILDLDDRAKYRIDKSPAIVILSDGEDTRMRMYGAPTGYEFVALVEAVLLAGTRQVDLEPETVQMLAAVEKPMRLQVFSTPT